MEIPFANDLNRYAMTLRESNNRLNQLQADKGMISPLPLEDPLIDVVKMKRDERDLFEGALLDFSMQLQFYEDKLGMTSPDTNVLIDDERQRRGVGEMRATFDALDSFCREPAPMDGSRKEQLDEQLNTLVNQSEEHLSLIHSGMAKFSSDVRGQYRVWIAVAWSCTVLAFCMVCALLWVFRSLVVKPFSTLLAGSRLVVEGQFDHRIDLGTSDELSELAEAMNGMTDRFQGTLAQLDSVNKHLDQQVQQRTREVIQNEQLASVGFLAAGVAHEINNPLATIAWSAESLVSRVSESSAKPLGQRIEDDDLCAALKTNLQRIEDEAFRCKGITEKLLDFSRLSEVRRAPTDLVELVNDVVTMVTKVGKYKCKTIRTHGCESLVADVNPQEIRQVVLNLVTNALESVATDGAVDVTIEKTSSMATIVVKDNGCGMSKEVLLHLFEPFFTRRRDGTGTGLGLSITYRIVSQHGGSLIANSDGDGHGSQIEIQLPLKQQDKDSIETSQQGTGDERDQATEE
jgi:signal transduction histidine kinase